MNRELTPGELLNDIGRMSNELTKKNMELSKLALRKDSTETIYRQELSKELLRLRVEKIPVAIINDIAKGNPKISKLRYERSLAKSNYFICISAIENLRLQIETKRSQLTWLRAELNNA